MTDQIEPATQFGIPKESAEWGRELASKRQVGPRKCLECGDEIPAALGRRTYCPDKPCRQKHFKRTHPDYWKRFSKKAPDVVAAEG